MLTGRSPRAASLRLRETYKGISNGQSRRSMNAWNTEDQMSQGDHSETEEEGKAAEERDAPPLTATAPAAAAAKFVPASASTLSIVAPPSSDLHKPVELCFETGETLLMFESVLVASEATECSCERIMERIEIGQLPHKRFFWRFSTQERDTNEKKRPVRRQLRPKKKQRTTVAAAKVKKDEEEETPVEVSETKSPSRSGPSRSPVERLSLKTGRVLEVFPSRMAAATSIGLARSSFSHKLRQGGPVEIKGFLWRIAETQPPPEPSNDDNSAHEDVPPKPSTGDDSAHEDAPPEPSNDGESAHEDVPSEPVVKERSLPRGVWRKPLEKLCPETQNVLDTFVSKAAAARDMGVTASVFSKALQESENYGGFLWRLAEDLPQSDGEKEEDNVNVSAKKEDELSPPPPPSARGNNRNNPVEKICPDTKEVLGTFYSQAAAARSVRISRSTLSDAMRLKPGTKCAGFYWRYANAEEEQQFISDDDEEQAQDMSEEQQEDISKNDEKEASDDHKSNEIDDQGIEGRKVAPGGDEEIPAGDGLDIPPSGIGQNQDAQDEKVDGQVPGDADEKVESGDSEQVEPDNSMEGVAINGKQAAYDGSEGGAASAGDSKKAARDENEEKSIGDKPQRADILPPRSPAAKYRKSWKPRPIEKLSPETLKVIQTFDSETAAARDIDVKRSTFVGAITLRPGKPFAGFLWRYVGESSTQKEESVSDNGGDISSSQNSEPPRRNSNSTAISSPQSGGSKSVQQVCPDSGKVMYTYPSRAAAARSMRMTSDALRIIMISSDPKCKGYVWRYKDDNIDDVAIGENDDDEAPGETSADVRGAKMVEKICPESQEVLETFSSQADAARSIRVAKSTFKANMQKNPQSEYKGFLWRFVVDGST